ncbi:hypothetical protein U1Q18_002050, partial [Sarracenia purpurea var. burkii]
RQTDRSTEGDDRIGKTDPCDHLQTPGSMQIDAARTPPGSGSRPIQRVPDPAPTDRGDVQKGGDAVLNCRGVGSIPVYGSSIFPLPLSTSHLVYPESSGENWSGLTCRRT